MSIVAYQTNLDETGRHLRDAIEKFLSFRAQELIWRDEEGITRCKNAEAGRVYSNWVRWNSDWNHWAERLQMAQAEAGQHVAPQRAPSSPPPVQEDLRLPRERDDEPPPEETIPF